MMRLVLVEEFWRMLALKVIRYLRSTTYILVNVWPLLISLC